MKSNKRSVWRNLPIYAVLSFISLIILFPFLWMITTSLKDPTKIFLFPPQWIPNPVSWTNFSQVFVNQPDFPLYFFNSAYIAVVVTAATCLFAALAGYAFGK